MKPDLRILHLEDDANDAELIRALLRRQGVGCQIEQARTREQFVAALARGECDLILSDFSMPGFDGLAALALAKERCPEVPFIFVSGTLGEEAAIDSLKCGAVDYLLKDRPSRLGTAIHRAMETAEERQALERAEESMVQSESKYRQLFECLADAAVLTDAGTGRVLDANKQAEILLGRTRGELIGLNQDHFLSPATLDEFRRRFADIAPGSERVTFDVEITSKEGRIILAVVSGAPLVLYGRHLILGIFRERPETQLT